MEAEILRSVRQQRRVPRTAAHPKIGLFKRPFLFLKEWAGLFTFLVWALYYFPSEAIDKYLDWTSAPVNSSREILVKTSELYIERIRTISAIPMSDIRNRDFIGRMYEIRIRNLVIPNIDTFRNAIGKLSALELSGIGSLLTSYGFIPEAVEFFDAAISSSADNKELPSIYKDKSRALSIAGPHQNKGASHAALLKALSILAAQIEPAAKMAYITILSELSIAEYEFGMEKCANFHRQYYYTLLKWAEREVGMWSGVEHIAPMYEAAVRRYPLMLASSADCSDRADFLPGAPAPNF